MRSIAIAMVSVVLVLAVSGDGFAQRSGSSSAGRTGGSYALRVPREQFHRVRAGRKAWECALRRVQAQDRLPKRLADWHARNACPRRGAAFTALGTRKFRAGGVPANSKSGLALSPGASASDATASRPGGGGKSLEDADGVLGA